MSNNDCTIMELYCLERAKLEPLNRGKWIAQAEHAADPGVRSPEPLGQGLLGQPGSRARPNHQLAKGSLIGRMDRFTDTAGG